MVFRREGKRKGREERERKEAVREEGERGIFFNKISFLFVFFFPFLSKREGGKREKREGGERQERRRESRGRKET